MLAQAGCFVPADKCVLGLVDQVFTRIHSLETAAVGMSSFSIDINAVGAASRPRPRWRRVCGTFHALC